VITTLALPVSHTQVTAALATAAALVTAAAGTAASWVATRFAGRSNESASRVAAQAAQVTLEGKLDSLSNSMRQSAKLVEEVSAELEARGATARRLQQEAQDAEALLRCTRTRPMPYGD
jgi:hypothetical protein